MTVSTRTKTTPVHWVFGVLSRISRILAGVSAVVLAVMAVHVTLDVIARSVRGYPLGSTLEIVVNVWMPAIVFFALAGALAKDEHLRVSLFIDGLSARQRRMADATAGLVVAGVLGVVCYALTAEAYYAFQIGETETGTGGSIPIWPAKIIAAVGAGLMAVQGLLQALATLLERGANQTHSVPGGGPVGRIN